MSDTILYGIPNCDTVKRARAWLDAHAVSYCFHDFKKAGLDAARLARWVDALGWEALLNRRGTTWRGIDPTRQAAACADAAGAQALMLEQTSVIRRPVMEWADGVVTAGFDPEVFDQRRG